MTAKLAHRVPDLAGVPEPMKQFYAPHKDGGFELQVDGAPKPDADADRPILPAGATLEQILEVARRLNAEPRGEAKPKQTAAQAREALLERIIDRIDPRPEKRAEVERTIAKLVQVDQAEDGSYVPRLNHPSGYRWPSSLPNTTFVDEFEFVTRVIGPKDHGGILAPELLRPPELKRTREELAFDDSEPFTRAPRNVRLPVNHTQRDFEDALRLAESRGGTVVFDEKLDKPVEPTAKYRPGRDVPLRSKDCDGPDGQLVFERAEKLAQQQGGQVVFVDERDERQHRKYDDPAPGTAGA